MKKYFYFLVVFLLLDVWTAFAQPAVSEKDFRTNAHPRVFVTKDDQQAILKKIESVDWAKCIYETLKADVDPIVAIHRNNPGYVVSRMQMHWEPGKRYTHFYTDGNFIPRREGNAKYPTVRVTYGRAASGSTPLVPLDKIIPYGDGRQTIPHGMRPALYRIGYADESRLSQIGSADPYDTVAFENSGLGVEAINRSMVHLAWKSAILYYLTRDKDYAKMAADIIWCVVRGAAQQEQVNPDYEQQHPGKVCSNGFLSFETLGDTRHFCTLPLTYDFLYDYLHDEYFDLKQFTDGIPGELWAPAHAEGKQWALQQFEIMFKKVIDNKLTRGGALHGNWNMNEQQSAMLYALALDDDGDYEDGHGREYYVGRLLYGPTTNSHGAYVDVLRGNISPSTGLWPEAPGGYGQGSIAQLVNFAFIYYKNGIDLFRRDPLLVKAAGSMKQMLFPNGYCTNVGDASYSKMGNGQLELMLTYAQETKNDSLFNQTVSMMQFASERDFESEFYFPLFYYLADIPKMAGNPVLPPVSYSSVYSLVFERNNASDKRDALAFTLAGFGKDMGHRQPNGLTMELYGRGHVMAPDQGIGQDYWSRDTHDYKINVAGHNTVSPNGCGASNKYPQNFKIVNAYPEIVEGADNRTDVAKDYQFVDVENNFLTEEVDALQRRTVAIVRTGEKTGYYLDIFRSRMTDGKSDKYHDYIYHNMGIDLDLSLPLEDIPLDSLSGKGYSFFQTEGSAAADNGFTAVFDLGLDDAKMKMIMPTGEGRRVYKLSSPNNHRYYAKELCDKPVPAILIRQQGEAWIQPFVAVFEPFGNDVDSMVDRVERLKSKNGAVRLKVCHKDGDYDLVTHDPQKNIFRIERHDGGSH